MGKLTVSYNNENIINTTNNGSFTLATKGKLMTDNMNIVFESGGGETTASQKDVNFIDYDGTIRYSYTASEFASLTALPANPSHSGLTAQGWNWSLADAKAYVASYGKLWIGQMYITDDGKTRIYIHLEEGRTSPMLGCYPNGTVVVDWGDGSATETLTGTSLTMDKWTSTHNYASAGDYIITLEVTSGTVRIKGVDSTRYYATLLRYSSDADIRNYSYQNAIQKIEIGKDIDIGDYAFKNCKSLNSITIPNNITDIGTETFNDCYSLDSITIPNSVTSMRAYLFSQCESLARIAIPNSVTSIASYVFSYCKSLNSITIPNSVTSIGWYMVQRCQSLNSITIPNSVTKIEDHTFSYCFSLTNITIPNNVTNIASYAFQYCNGLAIIRFEPTTPPTVSSTDVWMNIPTDCVIFVPTGTLSAYTSATNYPDPATYTYIDGSLQ